MQVSSNTFHYYNYLYFSFSDNYETVCTAFNGMLG